MALPLVMGLIAVAWQGSGSVFPGWGLVTLFAINVLANTIPNLPGCELPRDLCLTMYMALALWATALVVVWKSTRSEPDIAAEGGELNRAAA
jgi:hypothetical protein